ncbi:MAG: hypothetical protein ACO3F7_01970 [Luteolibacter sp.]
MRIHTTLIGFLVFANFSHASELKIEPRPFTVEKIFSASVMPSGVENTICIEPKAWSEFRIEEVAEHGQRVNEGDILMRFDAEAIDRKLEDLRREIASGKIALDDATQDLAQMQETATHRLEALQRAARVAAEENDYFLKTRRKAQAETADQLLERKKQLLANEQEELKQLKKMYEADDLTENTEEIILTRQMDAVAAAEFALRMEQLDYERRLEVQLPREEVSLANASRDAEIQLRYATTGIPRSIEKKKSELETLKTNQERAVKQLADLENDRALFEIKAKFDGWFYHGAIENGRWSRDESKPLAKYGKPSINQAIATLVSAKSGRVLTAHLDQQTIGALPAKFDGIAIPPGREELEIPVSLSKVASIPSTGGTTRMDLTAKWPENFEPVIGTSMTVRVICHHRDAALLVPRKALERDPRGWTVSMKVADGKNERRVVRCGKRNADEVEILSGIEAGQVILVP